MTSKDDSTDVQLDIGKYEGHTDHQDWKENYEWVSQNKGDSWVIYDINIQDALLLRDAPLLLEEVKRLRTEIAVLKNQYQSCQKSLMDQTNWSVRLVEAIDGGKMSEIKRVRNS